MEIKKLNKRVIETPIFNSSVGELGGYVGEEVTLCNTSLATQIARYFEKYKKYPFPPPTPKDEKDKYYYKRFQESRYYDNYKTFWDEEENKRRNGIIIPGKLLSNGNMQQIKITGHHYSYLNYTKILHDTDKTKVNEKINKNRPKFARAIGKPIDAFPDFWDGDYHYFSALELAKKYGLNLTVDKTRQVGYSHKNSMIAVDNYDLLPGSTSILGAYLLDYLTEPGATFDMCKTKINFINAYTDWKKIIRGTGVGSKDVIESGYVYKNTKVRGGFSSKIIAMGFGNNTGAARGKKQILTLFEESGKWINLRECLTATIKSQKEGDIITGIMIIFGTGGGKNSKNYEDFEYIFYNPLEFDCLPFVNIWDDNMAHTVCGFFHPKYLNYKPYYDKDGNSDINIAKQAILEKREQWKNTGREDLYKENIAEEPIKPSESFDASTDNIFTTAELVEHTNRVAHDTYLRFAQHGAIIKQKNGLLQFYQNNELDNRFKHSPIESINRRAKDDVHGCTSIWEFPYKNDENLIPEQLYYILHDPYAISTEKDKISHLHSLGAAYVYQRTNTFTNDYGDKIVAKLMGRPENIEDYNDQLIKLAEYYGCIDRQIWYESDRGVEFRNYCEKNKITNYLAYESELDSNKEIRAGKKVRSYGISMNANKSRKLESIKQLRAWIYRQRGTREDGHKIYNLHLIYDLRLLKELMRWHMSGNFDGVSAMLLLPFLESSLELNTFVSKLKISKNEQGILNPEFLINNMF